MTLLTQIKNQESKNWTIWTIPLYPLENPPFMTVEKFHCRIFPVNGWDIEVRVVDKGDQLWRRHRKKERENQREHHVIERGVWNILSNTGYGEHRAIEWSFYNALVRLSSYWGTWNKHFGQFATDDYFKKAKCWSGSSIVKISTS